MEPDSIAEPWNGLAELRPAVRDFLTNAAGVLQRLSGDVAMSQQRALQALAHLRAQQALALSYFDVFWYSGVVAIVLVVLVLFMRRSAATKGEHLAAE